MFIGTITDIDLPTKLHPRLNSFFNFVKLNNLNDLPLGRLNIQGDEIFVNNLLLDGNAENHQPLEMHCDYIDVHILLDGSERIGWKPLSRIKTYSQEYSKKDDCALSQDTPDFYVDLHPGDYCIVFPEDAHAPAISCGKIRKLIGKIKI